LHLYGQRFTTVEGNTTFYSTPDKKAIARWVADTPETFRFCPKLPKPITHGAALHPRIEDAKRFLGHMQNLGNRLGPIFAQLPPRYSPEKLRDLEAFLTGLSHLEADFALEVRHPDWFKPPYANQLTHLLSGLGIGRVVLDTRPIYDVPADPQLLAERKKPRVPVEFSVTAPFSLIRYVSHPQWETNLPFLQDWSPQVDHWLQQGTRIYFFVHCPLEARSPTNARQIQYRFEQQGIPIPPLPWDQIGESPTQLRLL
jgi:uncharacterized protein YecE (DUF72 family)